MGFSRKLSWETSECQGILFSKVLKTLNLEDRGYVPDPFQFSNMLQLLNNQLCQDSSISFFFEKVNKEHLKTVNVNY